MRHHHANAHHPRSSNSPRLALAALVASLTATPGAHAQSSYSMTVLKQNTSRYGVTVLLIDEQDRVLTNLPYFDHYAWHITNQFPTQYKLVPEYTNFPARWPASATLSSVSPTKIIKTEAEITFISTDGNKGYLYSSNLPIGVYDTLTSRSLTVDGQPKAVNNSGAIVGDHVREDATSQTSAPDETSGAALWVPNKPRQDLALPSPYVGARAIALTEKNVVVGEVFEPGTLRSRAARWINGALEVLDKAETSSTEASYATEVSDAGHVLVARQAFSVTSTTLDPVTGKQVIERKFGPERYSVVFNGTDTPIQSITPGSRAIANDMNASGTVVGQLNSQATYGGYWHQSHAVPIWPDDQGRAFIWKNGVMTDLTTLVASKGVKLPVGAVFTNAASINDKGSIAAIYRDQSGVKSLVRLTAKP